MWEYPDGACVSDDNDFYVMAREFYHRSVWQQYMLLEWQQHQWQQLMAMRLCQDAGYHAIDARKKRTADEIKKDNHAFGARKKFSAKEIKNQLPQKREDSERSSSKTLSNTRKIKKRAADKIENDKHAIGAKKKLTDEEHT